MIIITGLGNPGEKFKNTPHNLGFELLDVFCKKNGSPDFWYKKKLDAMISEKENILLLKPQTFMNNSGKAVRKVKGDLILCHDDIDLPLGFFRISKDRGPAGHKGVESVIRETGTQDFIRIRIGICPERGKPKDPEKFVLKRFSKEARLKADNVLSRASEALKVIIESGLEYAMNEYNKAV
ncbi:aminoacyl-tRNA hydrolase [Patescibacteria group bacterium]|nr:aminoacyl-tRNA hydrolase [Patescibacteria group bacterium]